MKNITITLPDDLAHKAKVFAAEHNTSVSRYVGDMLAAKIASEKGYQRAMSAWKSRSLKALQEKPSGYPRRDTLYER